MHIDPHYAFHTALCLDNFTTSMNKETLRQIPRLFTGKLSWDSTVLTIKQDSFSLPRLNDKNDTYVSV